MQRLKVIDRGKTHRPFVGHEQRQGKGGIGIGQADHHVITPGPDVQGFFFQLKTAIGASRDGQLFVGMVEDVGGEFGFIRACMEALT